MSIVRQAVRPLWALILACVGLVPTATATDFAVPPGQSRTIFVPVDADWRDKTDMTITLRTAAADAAGSFRTIIVDKNEFWFESTTQPLAGVGSTTRRLDLTTPADWRAAGNVRRPFARDVLRWIRRWGVVITNNSDANALTGTVAVTLATGEAPEPGAARLRYPARGLAGQTAEFTISHLPGPAPEFALSWQSANASGRVGFFELQRFNRIQPPFAAPRVTPLGRSVLAARWQPPTPGTYQLQLLRNGKPYDSHGPLPPFVVNAPDSQSTPAPAAEPDQFLHPPGHPLRDLAAEPAAAPAPPTASWHAQLEWTPDWGAYLGSGSYNQQVAWELDQALAQHTGQPLPLLLFSDDELDPDGTFNWPENPLNKANGGPLALPGDFYRHPRALDAIVARGRYLLNRYRTYAGVDGLLIESRHPASEAPAWAAKVANRLRTEFPNTPIRFASPRLAPPQWSAPLSLGAWQPTPALQTTATTVSTAAGGTVRIQTEAAGVAAVIAKRVEHLAHAATLSFTVDPQIDHQTALQVMVLLKNADGTICQSPLMRLAAELAHTFEVPLADLTYWRNADGKPALTDRRQLATMDEVAFRFFCPPNSRIDLALTDVNLNGARSSDSSPPVFGPFDAPWRDNLVVASSGGRWYPVAEPPTSHWQLVLDWRTGYGKQFHQGIAAEFDRAIRADTATPKPLLLFSEDELDDDTRYNWADHPLNAQNGGPLKARNEFYRHPAAFAAVLARARFLLDRYGDAAATNGLLIDLRYRHAPAVDWVRRLAIELNKSFPKVPVYCNNPQLPRRSWQVPTRIAAGWQPDKSLSTPVADGAPPRTFIRQHPVDRDAPYHRRFDAATITTQGQTAIAVTNSFVQHWAHVSEFACTIIPSPNCRDLRVTAMLRTDDDRLFESPLMRTYGDYPHLLVFPLKNPEFWSPRGGDRKLIPELDLLNVHEVVLRFFNLPPDRSQITVANTTVSGIPRLELAKIPELAIEELVANADTIPQYQRFELDFQLNRAFRNPYNPEEIAVDLQLTDPTGKKLSHPGFYWEDWAIAAKDGVESVTKGQRTGWKVRFTPQLPGTYSWTLVARHRKDTVEASGTFVCTPGDRKGFVVVSKQDPRYFEFSNGDFYYPIGHNLRSPSDRREGAYGPEVLANCTWAEKAGTYAFEKWFAKMAANGANFARIWTTAWWLGLEWSPQHPGYHGLGFYNQANAQRLDRIIQLAETHGIYLNLELSNHGAISSKVDTEWDLNPLNYKQPGGFLRSPLHVLSHPRAQALLKQRLRYVAARWGHSPAIALWGTVTEAEWADAYEANNEGYRRWLDQYGATIQNLNSAHPQAVTTHFSYPARAGSIWNQKHLQVTHTNAYDTMRDNAWQRQLFDRGHGIADRLFVFGKGLEPFPQPLLVGEWGGNHLENKSSHLLAELHTGLWASYFTHASGATGFWWWNLVDHADAYDRFKGLASFARNEDRRGKNYQSTRGTVVTDWAPIGEARIRPPQALLLHNDTDLFAYVYASEVNRFKSSTLTTSRTDDSLPLKQAAQLTLPPTLSPGTYKIEFWDTYAGTVIQTATINLSGAAQQLPLPPFSTDLALKLKKQ